MPVGELLDRMDANEVAEWKAYFTLKNLEAEGKGVPWTEEEIWGSVPRDPDAISRDIDRLMFGFNEES